MVVVVLAAATLGGVALGSFLGELNGGESGTVSAGSDSASPTTTSAPAPTTTAPTTTTQRRQEAATLRRGDRGPEVEALQQRLTDLGYWLGHPDGTYGALTEDAVLAFQKAEGFSRDGIAGPGTRQRLAAATRPAPRATTGDGIEIDLDRQLLLVVRDGRVRWALHTSTGSRATPTPPGRFVVTRGVDGIDHGPLGDLYRPRYFNRGIAMHGYPTVPTHPASHGCARLSLPAMDLLWATGAAPIGSPVAVS
jgi:lipoprotein-anchoring transpeptidase ErfK/SrfK